MVATGNPLDGILLIDKPQGITSHDVVDVVRRKLKTRKVGHAGTLDPLATGLLIMLIGKATKVSQYVMSLDKAYEGVLKLGEVTNTQDSDGQIVETHEVPNLSQEEVIKVANTFVGDQYQLPPMFSAKKIDGVPLYKIARKGGEVKREPRFINVSKFKILSFNSPEVEFLIKCSKGTYIRTLANDLGKKIGCGAHLIKLRRTESSPFNIQDAINLAEFEEMALSDIKQRLLSVGDVLPTHVL